MEKQYVYEACYCPCIYESVFGTISLHKTRKGAEMAMEFHKENLRKEHQELVDHYKKETGEDWDNEFGAHEAWDVVETELKD